MSDYTRQRWEEIKAMRPRAWLFHDSARKGTYNVGRNKAKRERRAREGVRK